MLKLLVASLAATIAANCASVSAMPSADLTETLANDALVADNGAVFDSNDAPVGNVNDDPSALVTDEDAALRPVVVNSTFTISTVAGFAFIDGGDTYTEFGYGYYLHQRKDGDHNALAFTIHDGIFYDKWRVGVCTGYATKQEALDCATGLCGDNSQCPEKWATWTGKGQGGAIACSDKYCKFALEEVSASRARKAAMRACNDARTWIDWLLSANCRVLTSFYY